MDGVVRIIGLHYCSLLAGCGRVTTLSTTSRLLQHQCHGPRCRPRHPRRSLPAPGLARMQLVSFARLLAPLVAACPISPRVKHVPRYSIPPGWRPPVAPHRISDLVLSLCIDHLNVGAVDHLASFNYGECWSARRVADSVWSSWAERRPRAIPRQRRRPGARAPQQERLLAQGLSALCMSINCSETHESGEVHRTGHSMSLSRSRPSR